MILPRRTSWHYSEHAPAFFTGQAGCYCCTSESKHVVAFGSAGAYIRDVDVYTLDFWSSMGDGPTPARRCYSAATISGKGYVYGGLQSGSPFTLADNDEYTRTGDTWAAKTSMSGGGKAVNAGCAASGKAYSFCGWDSALLATKTAHEYDASGDSWSAKTDAPTPTRITCCAVEIGTKAYLINGVDGSTALNDTDEYDPSGDSWTSKTNSPTVATTYNSAVQLSSKGYVGFGNSSNDMNEYDPDTWTAKTDAGTSRYGTGASAGTNGAGLFSGGSNGSADQTSHEEYTPDGWTTRTNLITPARFAPAGFQAS